MKKNIAIKVENLGKKYRIGEQEKYLALRDKLTNLIKLPSQIINSEKNKKKNIWALKNVSFEVKKGEVLGIIGPNGAGKSTLLKILSKITEPTEGKVQLRGRISSLLEVGTGFHSELTGRENVYLNGAILGMSRKEIGEKFDEIVEFSGIGKFLDTPVKHYSSGMRVRLAFSVAAHLEPEILLIDEVLAVGDAEFQKKCLGKMDEVSRKEGRTILFVSHDMNAIEKLCDSCLLLENGEISILSKDIKGVINGYLFKKSNIAEKACWMNDNGKIDNDYFKLKAFYIGNKNGSPIEMPVRNNQDFWVYIKGELKKTDRALNLGYAIYSKGGQLLYWSLTTDKPKEEWPKMKSGNIVLKSKIPPHFLNEGVYRIELIGSLHCVKWLFKPLDNSPSIYLSVRGKLSDSPLFIKKRPGLFAPILNWTLEDE